jgi:hypothetical protein
MVCYGLNPSKADEVRSDNTCTKELTLATRWGFGGLIKLNAYGWCSTSPAEMKKQGVAAIGDLNDYWIQAVERTFGPRGRNVIGLRLACWGIHDFLNRGAVIREYIPDLHHLGLNLNGTPKHPLYLPMTVRPILFA